MTRTRTLLLAVLMVLSAAPSLAFAQVTSAQHPSLDESFCGSQKGGCTRKNADGSITTCGGALGNSTCKVVFPDKSYTVIKFGSFAGQDVQNFDPNGKPIGGTNSADSNALNNQTTGTPTNYNVTNGGTVAGNPNTTDGTAFVPLSQLPGLGNVVASGSFGDFLNQLYRILIGIAAVAAVLQFIRAGVELMTSQGSFAQNAKAKQHISNAVIGLVLVLSPYIILGVINPTLRNINVNFGTLQSTAGGNQGTSYNPGGNPNTPIMWVDNSADQAAPQQKCASQNGTAVFVCTAKDGTSRQVAQGTSCNTGETAATDCLQNAGTAGTPQSCTQYSSLQATQPGSGDDVDLQNEGYAKVPDSCCSGIQSGYACYGK